MAAEKTLSTSGAGGTERAERSPASGHACRGVARSTCPAWRGCCSQRPIGCGCGDACARGRTRRQLRPAPSSLSVVPGQRPGARSTRQWRGVGGAVAGPASASWRRRAGRGRRAVGPPRPRPTSPRAEASALGLDCACGRRSSGWLPSGSTPSHRPRPPCPAG